MQTKLRENEALKTPEKKSPKNSPSTKKKRSLKSKLYSERLKRMKQDKTTAQYEDSDSDELPKNGKNVVDSSCNIEKEETEISKIQRDLEILNQQIREDLEARKKRRWKWMFVFSHN